MRDDYLSADWSRHHFAVTDALHRLFQTVAVSFDRLHAIQYDAPWKRGGTARRSTVFGTPAP